jgi:hypothetical protein
MANFEINFPLSWDEITLKQYQDIETLYDKNENATMIDILDIISDKTAKELKTLPFDVFEETIMPQLNFLNEKPEEKEPTNKIVIKGETYFVNFMEKMKTGEFIDSQMVLQNDKHNYAMLLAILCRKEGEIYDSRFENEILPSRIAFWEKQPMLECMRIASFFLNLWLIFGQRTQLSSQVMEALDLTAKHIETSHRNGELSRLSMKLLMRKLKKLRKSISFI